MPYKSERIKIAGTKFDKRVKLTDDERKAILILAEQNYSQRKLATMFNVSRRLIQSLLHPVERCAPKKHTKEYWAEIKKRYRKRKQDLLAEGKIKIKIKTKKNEQGKKKKIKRSS